MFGVEEKKNRFPLNLQFFAGKDDEDVTDGDEDDQDDNNDPGDTDVDKDNDKDKKSSSKGSSTIDDKSKSKIFTQEQVSRMMTKEKNQGRNAVLRELGIDPKDTKAVAMVKAIIESQKTDEQKTAEKNAEENEKLREANERALKAEAKAEAMVLGVKSQFVDDLIALVLSKKTDEDADMKTLIGEYKTKYPVWFGEDDTEDDDKADETKNKKTGQKGTGVSVKSSGKDKQKEETKGLGARLAAQRKGPTKKTSYWS